MSYCNWREVGGSLREEAETAHAAAAPLPAWVVFRKKTETNQ